MKRNYSRQADARKDHHILPPTLPVLRSHLLLIRLHFISQQSQEYIFHFKCQMKKDTSILNQSPDEQKSAKRVFPYPGLNILICKINNGITNFFYLYKFNNVILLCTGI